MRIAIISDMHGNLEALSKIIDAIEKQNVDLIISSGDFADDYQIPQGFTLLDIVETFIQKLLSLRKPVLCIPGNVDPLEIIDIFEEYKINLQNKKTKIGDLTFVGWGGALTPFETNFEPTEQETKNALEKLGTGIKGDLVLVLHNPPKNTKLDLVQDQHVGSQSEREFIEKTQPLLAISAHIHESAGIDKIGQTTLFYPGQATEGKYGIVDIKGKTVICEKMTIS